MVRALALVTLAALAPSAAFACGMRHDRPVQLADLMDEVDAPAPAVAAPSVEAHVETPAPAVVAPVAAPKPTAAAPAVAPKPTAKVPNT